MWEKAAAQKLKAAETAATLQGQITQAAASIRGHEISKEGTLGAANIRAAADKETTKMTSDATKYSADQRLLGDRVSAAASARATSEAAAGRLSKFQSDAINRAAEKLSLLPSELEAVHNKNPDYVAAVKAKAMAERALANNPDSAPMKTQLANAQKAIGKFTENDGNTIRTARERLEAMERKYYGPDYVASPAASTSYTMSAEDARALEWAKSNPKDPRAAAIKQRLGQ
jgi:flagellar basal body rod protein FlgB